MHPYIAHLTYFSSLWPDSRPGAPAFPKRPEAGDGAFRTWFRSAYRHWQRNKMIAAFQSLDDATLRDIGVERSEIPSVVDGLDDLELRMAPVAAKDDARRR